MLLPQLGDERQGEPSSMEDWGDRGMPSSLAASFRRCNLLSSASMLATSLSGEGEAKRLVIPIDAHPSKPHYMDYLIRSIHNRGDS